MRALRDGPCTRHRASRADLVRRRVPGPRAAGLRAPPGATDPGDGVQERPLQGVRKERRLRERDRRSLTPPGLAPARRVALALAIALACAACGGGGAGKATPPAPPPRVG